MQLTKQHQRSSISRSPLSPVLTPPFPLMPCLRNVKQVSYLPFRPPSGLQAAPMRSRPPATFQAGSTPRPLPDTASLLVVLVPRPRRIPPANSKTIQPACLPADRQLSKQLQLPTPFRSQLPRPDATPSRCPQPSRLDVTPPQTPDRQKRRKKPTCRPAFQQLSKQLKRPAPSRSPHFLVLMLPTVAVSAFQRYNKQLTYLRDFQRPAKQLQHPPALQQLAKSFNPARLILMPLPPSPPACQKRNKQKIYFPGFRRHAKQLQSPLEFSSSPCQSAARSFPYLPTICCPDATPLQVSAHQQRNKQPI